MVALGKNAAQGKRALEALKNPDLSRSLADIREDYEWAGRELGGEAEEEVSSDEERSNGLRRKESADAARDIDDRLQYVRSSRRGERGVRLGGSAGEEAPGRGGDGGGENTCPCE